MIMISKNVIGIYMKVAYARGGRIAAGGGLFAAGLIAGGLFASGLNAAPHIISGIFRQVYLDFFHEYVYSIIPHQHM